MNDGNPGSLFTEQVSAIKARDIECALSNPRNQLIRGQGIPQKLVWQHPGPRQEYADNSHGGKRECLCVSIID